MPGRARPDGDALAEYRRKRSFDKTPEPAGAVRQGSGAGISRFVVQKHRATRLHYDVRLEMGGVLVSWAVPKGPSLNPADRRLAVHVEDHPVEYFSFEGVIPKGEYGGGTVMVWDWGGVRWLGEDPVAMLARGDLKFELYGRKLIGSWAIVGKGKDMFMIHKRDHGASEEDVTAHDRSVLTGRSMDEIAADAERVWHSGRPAHDQGGGDIDFVDLRKAKKAAFPTALEPMLATSEKEPFDDAGWSYEVKLDGFRNIAHLRRGKVTLRSRRGQDATRQFPEVSELATLFRGGDAVLDGEVIALDEEGRPSFQALQERTGWRGGKTSTEPHPKIAIVYYVFDILYDGGLSLLDVPLSERRRLLQARLLNGPSVRLLDTFPGTDGKLLFRVVKAQGQEGVVAKKLDSKYLPGKRVKTWLKFKAAREQACAVVGYTPPEGGRKHFGSLAVAVLEDGDMAYAGQVGSGFNERLLAEVMGELEKSRLPKPPPMKRANIAPKTVQWVQPGLVCEVKYTEWTRDGVLRQPTLLRMRPDMVVDDCRREPG